VEFWEYGLDDGKNPGGDGDVVFRSIGRKDKGAGGRGRKGGSKIMRKRRICKDGFRKSKVK
jgi:hypothetical protein